VLGGWKALDIQKNSMTIDL